MVAAKLVSKLVTGSDLNIGTLAGISTTGGTFEGVAVTDAFHANKYEVGETARLLTEGQVWLDVSDQVAAGDKLMVTASTGVLAKAAGTANTTYTLNDSRVITANGATGGLALVELHGVSLTQRGA